MLNNLLHSPVSAGAYVYGIAPSIHAAASPGGRTVAPPQQWEVLLKDHLPASTGWDQYGQNLPQLAANNAEAGGGRRAACSVPAPRCSRVA
jgi:hypothetical protein